MIEDLKNTKWIAVFDPKPTIDDVFETNMIGKYIKTCPHKYTELLRYDFLCYLDNKVSMNDDVVIKYIDTYCIKQCGIQDQISFFFVKQLFDNNIHIYSDNLNYYN